LWVGHSYPLFGITASKCALDHGQRKRPTTALVSVCGQTPEAPIQSINHLKASGASRTSNAVNMGQAATIPCSSSSGTHAPSNLRTRREGHASEADGAGHRCSVSECSRVQRRTRSFTTVSLCRKRCTYENRISGLWRYRVHCPASAASNAKRPTSGEQKFKIADRDERNGCGRL
jgi:hypothetical protein